MRIKNFRHLAPVCRRFCQTFLLTCWKLLFIWLAWAQTLVVIALIRIDLFLSLSYQSLFLLFNARTNGTLSCNEFQNYLVILWIRIWVFDKSFFLALFIGLKYCLKHEFLDSVRLHEGWITDLHPNLHELVLLQEVLNKDVLVISPQCLHLLKSRIEDHFFVFWWFAALFDNHCIIDGLTCVS